MPAVLQSESEADIHPSQSSSCASTNVWKAPRPRVHQVVEARATQQWRPGQLRGPGVAGAKRSRAASTRSRNRKHRDTPGLFEAQAEDAGVGGGGGGG
jgi:hypothetical protein